MYSLKNSITVGQIHVETLRMPGAVLVVRSLKTGSGEMLNEESYDPTEAALAGLKMIRAALRCRSFSPPIAEELQGLIDKLHLSPPMDEPVQAKPSAHRRRPRS